MDAVLSLCRVVREQEAQIKALFVFSRNMMQAHMSIRENSLDLSWRFKAVCDSLVRDGVLSRAGLDAQMQAQESIMLLCRAVSSAEILHVVAGAAGPEDFGSFMATSRMCLSSTRSAVSEMLSAQDPLFAPKQQAAAAGAARAAAAGGIVMRDHVVASKPSVVAWPTAAAAFAPPPRQGRLPCADRWLERWRSCAGRESLLPWLECMYNCPLVSSLMSSSLDACTMGRLCVASHLSLECIGRASLGVQVYLLFRPGESRSTTAMAVAVAKHLKEAAGLSSPRASLPSLMSMPAAATSLAAALGSPSQAALRRAARATAVLPGRRWSLQPLLFQPRVAGSLASALGAAAGRALRAAAGAAAAGRALPAAARAGRAVPRTGLPAFGGGSAPFCGKVIRPRQALIDADVVPEIERKALQAANAAPELQPLALVEASAEDLQPNQQVLLCDLQQHCELNGSTGRLIRRTRDRWHVCVAGGKGYISVQTKNLKVLKKSLALVLRKETVSFPEDRGGRIFVIGGKGSETSLKDVEMLDISTNTWRQLPPMTQRRSHPCAVHLEGCIYVCGGHGTIGVARARGVLDTVERFDIVASTWKAMPPMLKKRSFAAAGVLGSRIYICGGVTWAGTPMRSTECFDPATSGWKEVAMMCNPRFMTISAQLRGRFLIAGGNGATSLRSVESFNPARNVWQSLPSMSDQRVLASSVVVGSRLYVIGGFSEEVGFLGSAECLSANSKAWQPLPPMTLRRCAAVAAAAPDGRIYVCGGSNDTKYAGQLRAVERYDPCVGRWEIAQPMAHVRGFASSAVVAGHLYVWGGKTNNGPLRHAERLDLGTGLWEVLPPMANARSGTCGVAFSD